MQGPLAIVAGFTSYGCRARYLWLQLSAAGEPMSDGCGFIGDAMLLRLLGGGSGALAALRALIQAMAYIVLYIVHYIAHYIALRALVDGPRLRRLSRVT